MMTAFVLSTATVLLWLSATITTIVQARHRIAHVAKVIAYSHRRNQ